MIEFLVEVTLCGRTSFLIAVGDLRTVRRLMKSVVFGRGDNGVMKKLLAWDSEAGVFIHELVEAAFWLFWNGFDVRWLLGVRSLCDKGVRWVGFGFGEGDCEGRSCLEVGVDALRGTII